MSMPGEFRTLDTPIYDNDSPDLMEVSGKIKQLREASGQTSRAREAQISAIQNDPQISDLGRKEQIAELEAVYATRRRASTDAENAVIDNKIAELDRRLDGHIGYSESSIIAYRDAQDRAESVEGGERAAKLMERALRSNDRTLAHALFRVAVENHWTEAHRAFAKENPAVAALVNDMQGLRKLRNQFGRFLAHM